MAQLNESEDDVKSIFIDHFHDKTVRITNFEVCRWSSKFNLKLEGTNEWVNERMIWRVDEWACDDVFLFNRFVYTFNISLIVLLDSKEKLEERRKILNEKTNHHFHGLIWVSFEDQWLTTWTNDNKNDFTAFSSNNDIQRWSFNLIDLRLALEHRTFTIQHVSFSFLGQRKINDRFDDIMVRQNNSLLVWLQNNVMDQFIFDIICLLLLWVHALKLIYWLDVYIVYAYRKVNRLNRYLCVAH